MNNYNEWSQLVARKIKAEGDLMAAINKDGLSDEAARDAFVRAVLTSFLPENLGVGSGQIVDAHGNHSEHFDIVVYNREFPRMSMQEAEPAYLYESVLATFVIRSKFVRKTIFDALNICASLAELKTNLDKPVLAQLARKNGVRLGPNQTWEHDDALQGQRFDLIARPPSFVFGFGGIKNSYRQLQESIELWIGNRDNDDIATPMKSLPAVIATQGCFAWRNAAPLALSNREMLGLGCDDAPVRLIVLQLLFLLNRRLRPRADGYGLKPDLGKYLSQFPPPKFEIGIGKLYRPAADQTAADAKPAKGPGHNQPTMSARYKPAKDHSSNQSSPEATESAASTPAASEPATKKAAADTSNSAPAAPVTRQEPEPAAPVTSQDPEPAEMAAQFTKPSPFASAPIPTMEDSSSQDEEPPTRSPFQSAPLGSAPIPGMAAPSAAAEPENRPVSAPLGSAPIPGMAPQSDTAEPENRPLSAPLGSAPIPPMATAESSTPQTASIIPPKPPVDFDLGAENEPNQAQASNTASQTADEEGDFTNTVIIPPDASASQKEQQRNSTEAFIARVKEQLSSPEALPEKNKDPFSSTIPQ